jgi:hypothetical protein
MFPEVVFKLLEIVIVIAPPAEPGTSNLELQTSKLKLPS